MVSFWCGLSRPAVSAAVDAGAVQSVQAGRSVTLFVPEKFSFETEKRIAATLQSERYNKFIFNIEGHTSDEHFSSAQYPSNWELSSARAASVARFLESRGINRVRLRTAGLYDVSPKYPNRDPFGEPIPQNRIKNRRVVIHVEPSYR